MRNTLRLLAGLLICGGKHRHRIFNKLLLPLGDLVLAEVMVPTQFCLRTFTAECLKNDLRFKLGGDGSSFSFRHRNSISVRLYCTHNLGLEGGLNFRWQYNYLELNEYGIVYYVMKLYEYEADTISMYEFIDGIDELLKYARRLYNACDAIVTIKVIAELENVFEKKMPRRLINGQIHLNSEPVCYTSKVFASTSKTYLSRNLKGPAHQKTIFEELIMQLLWAFNIPTDNEHLIGYIRKAIEDRISE